ncbi:hypothetical protein [Polaribacter tangerinus]|uniref:hypothetical protein n=1 Tax=Polaribacter tangerinus TaxID=1920034 RepID=UPI000B4A94CE|nr:hypothetical protein [Polaribacter tangerinus]
MPLRKNNKSITFLAKNSKIINFIGLLLIVLGAVISYFNWNVEPEETIGGFCCGLGFGLLIIGLTANEKTKN